jgi:hypothetical protein
MLKLVLRRIAAGLIAAALAAAAASVGVVAAGFALYALLRLWLSPPAAGGLTALAFACLAGAAALAAPAIWKRRRGPATAGKSDPLNVRTVAEAVLAFIAASADLRRARAAETRAKERAGKGRK